MTLETGLMCALGATWAALGAGVKLAVDRFKQGETELSQTRDEISDLRERIGKAEGELTAYRKCPHKNCPFAGIDD